MSNMEFKPVADNSSVSVADPVKEEAEDFDFLPYCSTCHEPCCNGNIFATKDEVRRVVKKAGKDIFKRKDGTRYLNPEDDCEYLDEQYRCTVHEQRPLICQLYPLYPVPTKKGLQVHIDHSCPAAEHLPQSYIDKMKKLARDRFRGDLFVEYRTFWLDEPADPNECVIPI